MGIKGDRKGWIFFAGGVVGEVREERRVKAIARLLKIHQQEQERSLCQNQRLSMHERILLDAEEVLY